MIRTAQRSIFYFTQPGNLYSVIFASVFRKFTNRRHCIFVRQYLLFDHLISQHFSMTFRTAP